MTGEKFRRTLKRAVDLETMQSISSDSLMSMSTDDYQMVRRYATRARLDGQARYVCGLCGHAVYAPREPRTGLPYWKHHAGAPEDCPWWTGGPSDVNTVSGRQFAGAQESPLHVKVKNIVGELLNLDVRTKPGSVIVDEYLLTDAGRRRPDVRAVYGGTSMVVEVQLATTQIPIIIQREDFYESEAIRLLWLTWNFEPPSPDGRLLSSFEDIFYSHNKNLFAMDDETVRLSRQEGVIFLRAFWMDDEMWTSKLVKLSELRWLPSGRAFAVPPELPWPEDFLARWRAVIDDRHSQWRERKALLTELAEKLSHVCADWRALEEADIGSLINCLLSLLDGHPVGSQQKNLVEVLNTFFYADRRHRYARLVHRFAELTGRSDALKTPSVQAKLKTALNVPQDSPQSVADCVALRPFPHIFPSSERK